MIATTLDARTRLESYLGTARVSPLFVLGDALAVLREFPSDIFDCCMTSPPYWGKREYASSGIGLERDYKDFIRNLSAVCLEIKRVLKPAGSFWLNIGDSYAGKNLVGIPWRIAIELMDEQGWILRNNVIWNKIKGGPDNTKDRLRNIHEDIFHFVKSPRGYYYDMDSIRSTPKQAKVVNGSVVSATGVRGVRYRRQIELSSELTEEEKTDAFGALEQMLGRVSAGEIADFRMITRGQQRTTHSDSEKVSGRAKELREKGFYFLTTIRTEANLLTSGTSCPRILKSERSISLPIPKICAKSRFLPHPPWAVWSWILSAGQVRPCPLPACSAGNPWV